MSLISITPNRCVRNPSKKKSGTLKAVLDQYKTQEICNATQVVGGIPYWFGIPLMHEKSGGRCEKCGKNGLQDNRIKKLRKFESKIRYYM